MKKRLLTHAFTSKTLLARSLPFQRAQDMTILPVWWHERTADMFKASGDPESRQPKNQQVPQSPTLLSAMAVEAGSFWTHKCWSVVSLKYSTQTDKADFCQLWCSRWVSMCLLIWTTLHSAQFCLLSLKAQTNSRCIVVPNLIWMVAFNVTRTTMLLMKDAAGFFCTTHSDKLHWRLLKTQTWEWFYSQILYSGKNSVFHSCPVES